MVLAWIVRALCSEIAQSVMFITKASDLWLELKQRFAQNNHTRIADLQEELYSMRQGDATVTSFFTHLKGLWGELENYRPLSICACGMQCVCKSHREQDCIMRFLKGLNEQFSGVRSQILLMDPLPGLNQVYSLILQQERQFASEGGDVPRVMAAGSNSQNLSGNGKKFVKGKFIKGQQNGGKV